MCDILLGEKETNCIQSHFYKECEQCERDNKNILRHTKSSESFITKVCFERAASTVYVCLGLINYYLQNGEKPKLTYVREVRFQAAVSKYEKVNANFKIESAVQKRIVKQVRNITDS